MTVQFVLQFLTIFVSGCIMLLLLLCAAGSPAGNSFRGKANEISWMLPETPAWDDFKLFALQAVIISAILVCALLQVSNHIIVTLDILYILSLSLLYLYQTFKVADLCFC